MSLFPVELGEIEVQGGEDEGGDVLRESRDDVQPSSSDTTRAFANVPSITITSVTGSSGDVAREQEPESGDIPTQHIENESGDGELNDSCGAGD